MKGSRQFHDATVAIKSVENWNLQEDEKKNYQSAMKKYFYND